MSDAIASVITGETRWAVECGDALEVIARIDSVHAVVTDPPYARTGDSASIASVKGRSRIGKEDQFFESWLREHLKEWNRVLRSTGACWFTIDWHGAVTVEKACTKLGWSAPAVGVWVRGGLGMGFVMRHAYECFCVVYKGDFVRRATDEADVWIHDWAAASRRHGHPAEKPVPLVERAMKLISGPDDLVLDPFCGSGTTGVACMRLGRRFLGIEREPEWAERARQRIAAEERDSTAEAARAGQEPLFRRAATR